MGGLRKRSPLKLLRHIQSRRMLNFHADYSAMLERADQCMSDADIIAVCRDIWEHSDNSLYIEYGGTFSSFAFDFMADCVHLFIKEDEE